MRRGYLGKAEEERMRVATWKLAALMGVVPTIGCVQKIVPSTDGPQLGTDAGQMNDMDAAVMPMGNHDSGMAKPDAGQPTGGLSCLTYCSEVLADCTGANTQFESMQQCMNMCGDMDLGSETDTSGNTVGCRIYHVRKGVTDGPIGVHCKHAGPSGAGVCGERCDNLCSRATKLCVEANGVQSDAYESYDACMDLCVAVDGGTDGYAIDPLAELPATGNTVNCRIYHLANAYKYIAGSEVNPDQLNAHCDHTREFSPVCHD
jgi:hypothetical protein